VISFVTRVFYVQSRCIHALHHPDSRLVRSGGGADLRDHDFNVANNDTEIFKIEGTLTVSKMIGPNAASAIRHHPSP
jgi:hypothetical protein